LKELLSSKIDKPANRLMLIHMGKVMKNTATLAEQNIVHNSAVHLVVRSAPDVSHRAPQSCIYMHRRAVTAHSRLDLASSQPPHPSSIDRHRLQLS
jgi:hypothetical protein